MNKIFLFLTSALLFTSMSLSAYARSSSTVAGSDVAPITSEGDPNGTQHQGDEAQSDAVTCGECHRYAAAAALNDKTKAGEGVNLDENGAITPKKSGDVQ